MFVRRSIFSVLKSYYFKHPDAQSVKETAQSLIPWWLRQINVYYLL